MSVYSVQSWILFVSKIVLQLATRYRHAIHPWTLDYRRVVNEELQSNVKLDTTKLLSCEEKYRHDLTAINSQR